MEIIINNDTIVVKNPSDELLGFAKSNLCYTDKSKQYQLKRMARNIWQRNSPLYAQLQKEVKGNLFSFEDNKLTISSSFYEMIKFLIPADAMVKDLRRDTGLKIVLPWVNKPHDLRDYQEEAVQAMLSSPRGIINLATGLGKTLLATHLVQRYKKRTLIVCPSESVAQQFYELFERSFGKSKIGFYGGGKKKINDLTIGIAASIVKGIDSFKSAELGLVLFDENHHTPASTFYDISQGLAGVGKMFGLTATPYRSDGKDIMITAGCGPILIKRDIKWGIENGWLAKPYFFIKTVHTAGKDYKDDKLKSYKEHVLNNQAMKSQILNDAKKMISAGKAVLILVDEVAHGLELSKQLNIPFATGLDPKSQEYVNQLNDGKIKGLIGTDGKISEGTDTKNVDVLILANFVASKGAVMQCVGRALRKQGTKTKVIICDYKPSGSTMLSRHADNRISFYRDITDDIKVIDEQE